MFTARIAYSADFFESQIPHTKRYLLYLKIVSNYNRILTATPPFTRPSPRGTKRWSTSCARPTASTSPTVATTEGSAQSTSLHSRCVYTRKRIFPYKRLRETHPDRQREPGGGIHATSQRYPGSPLLGIDTRGVSIP